MAAGSKSVVIVGAGIAGLTLALMLAKFGARVTLVEKSPRLQEVGAGLQVAPNARKVLDALGLGPEISALAFEPQGVEIYSAGAFQPLVTVAMGAEMRQRFGAPNVVMHRADLADLLHRAAKRFANIDILFGVRGYDITDEGGHPVVRIDESDGKSRLVRAFAVIGADGIYSTLRTGLLGGPLPRYSGHVAYRLTAPVAVLPDLARAKNTRMFWGSGHHLVAYPLPAKGTINLIFAAEGPKSTDFAEGKKRPLPDFALRLKGALGEILRAVPDDWTYWPMGEVTTPRWTEGAIGLIGDAAHAMLPFQAQGAAMAIEDAAVLAPLLVSAPSAPEALTAYEATRRPRVERVQRLSRFNGEAYHMGWPASVARDLAVKSMGPLGQIKRLDWLWGHEPGSPPAASAAGR